MEDFFVGLLGLTSTMLSINFSPKKNITKTKNPNYFHN